MEKHTYAEKMLSGDKYVPYVGIQNFFIPCEKTLYLCWENANWM